MPTKNDQVLVQSIHGMSVAGTGLFTFRLDLYPAQLIPLGEVNLPDIVQELSAYRYAYFSVVPLLMIPPKINMSSSIRVAVCANRPLGLSPRTSIWSIHLICSISRTEMWL